MHYRNWPDIRSCTVDKASYLRSASACPINSIIRVFAPRFWICLLLQVLIGREKYVLAWGTYFTSCPTSWHPTANTIGFFDVASNRARIFNSLLFWSSNLLAFSRQKSSLRCGGVQDKWPDSSSEEYSSNVLLSVQEGRGGGNVNWSKLAWSSSWRNWRSSRISWSVHFRPERDFVKWRSLATTIAGRFSSGAFLTRFWNQLYVIR